MTTRIACQHVSKTYPVSGRDMFVSLRDVVFGRTASTDTGRGRSAQVVAVDDVSLLVETGQRVGIIGRNGAGKSTLLKMIAGLTEPTTGTVHVQGRVTSIFTLGIGLRDDLSGRENIYLDGEVHGQSRRRVDAIVDDVIAFAELGRFIDYPVRTYSTGMKARLAFATIIHVDPEILVIDEALSVGDTAFSVKATAKIRELCARGKIVIVVSHGMDSIRQMCTRCLWLDHGRLVMDGDPATVTRAYLDAVRREDETVLLDRFRRLIGGRSYRPGCAVTALSVGHAEATAQAVLAAGESAVVDIAAQIDAPLDAPDLRLRIVRLDGVVVTENLLGEEAPGLAEPFRGSVRVAVAFRPLLLGPSVYRVTAEVLANGDVVAERSTVIEVVADRLPIGGRSLLLQPCSVTATAIR